MYFGHLIARIQQEARERGGVVAVAAGEPERMHRAERAPLQALFQRRKAGLQRELFGKLQLVGAIAQERRALALVHACGRLAQHAQPAGKVLLRHRAVILFGYAHEHGAAAARAQRCGVGNDGHAVTSVQLFPARPVAAEHRRYMHALQFVDERDPHLRAPARAHDAQLHVPLLTGILQ